MARNLLNMVGINYMYKSNNLQTFLHYLLRAL